MKQYVDKSALLAEIEKRLHANGAFDEFGDEAWAEDVGMCNAYKSILSFLDTLEVKEVNLEKELETLNSLLYDLDGIAVKGTTSYLTVEDIKDIAKHFFELGLKAQKGE